MEPNTWFHKFPPKLPDDENIFSTQKNCQHLLADKGYKQYEVSAYSQPGQQCRHNVNYWQFGDYLGIGAGAHGKITNHMPTQIIRTAKAKSPEVYMNNPVKSANSQTITLDELPLEFVMKPTTASKRIYFKPLPKCYRSGCKHFATCIIQLRETRFANLGKQLLYLYGYRVEFFGYRFGKFYHLKNAI